MRLTLAALFASLFLLPGLTRAQTVGPLHITDVRVGFPAGTVTGEHVDDKGRTTLFKSGVWAPVAIDIEAGADGTDQPGQVTIETSDSDEMQNRYHSELPPLKAGEKTTVVTYVRPGSLSSTVHVTIDAGQHRAETTKRVDALDLGEILYLTLGSPLPGLRQELSPREEANPDNPTPSHYRAATVEQVAELPTKWFGYDAVDHMILPSGNRKFIVALAEDNQGRKEALAEWVRRGGKLIVSAGQNHKEVAQLLQACFPKSAPLGLEIVGGRKTNRVQELERLHPGKRLPAFVQQPDASGRVPVIELATFAHRPGQPIEVMMPRQGSDLHNALIARTPYGLGQVTLVGFDLDQMPFVRWGGQSDFWSSFLHLRTTAASDNANSDADNETSNDLAAQLQNKLEQFQDVPVISFGWVALLIFLYVLVIGPLDYFILKKVIGRLEFTWVTFPVLVLSISGLAFFAVSSLKGHELRVNKVDVVDVDLQSGQSYGQTWFTLFSPKIDHYTVGVEPAAPTWAAEPHSESQNPSALTTWLGRPDNSYGGYGRARSQGLFHQAYDYKPEAAGLSEVPIQIWATKSFTASWRRPLDPSRKTITAELHHQGPERLAGTVTNHLPVALDEVALIWGSGAGTGSVFRIGHLGPNEKKEVSLRAGENTQRLSDWASGILSQGDAKPDEVDGLMRRILFHGQITEQQRAPDVALPRLDQSWRTRLPDEVMMFARIPAAPYQSVPAGVTDPRLTSLLWLGAVPGSGARPALQGTLRQDTYLRFFIPVQSAPGHTAK